jgi:hypothetical protein
VTTSNSRYQGKPLLRLLECYVLWAIDQLSAKDMQQLTEMTPKLQSIYNARGSWQKIIAGVMEFPAEMPGKVRALWIKNSEIARQSGAILTPQEFAEMFVDQNLV